MPCTTHLLQDPSPAPAPSSTNLSLYIPVPIKCLSKLSSLPGSHQKNRKNMNASRQIYARAEQSKADTDIAK